MNEPILVLLPNLLNENETHPERYLPSSVYEWMQNIDGLIAESEKPARVFLKRFTYKEGKTFRDIPIRLLNEHTKEAELTDLIAPVLQGQTWGLISDAGLPCFADPGSKLVYLARQKNIRVEACVGPSSLIFSLLLSGLSAQNFHFHGYLAKTEPELQKQLVAMQKETLSFHTTQVFIETPYRCHSLFDILLRTLEPTIKLCVAADITLPTQYVMTKTVARWQKEVKPDLAKRLVVFLFGT